MQRYLLCLAIVCATYLVVPAKIYAEDAAEHIKRAKACLGQSDCDTRLADCEKAVAECGKAIAIDPKSTQAYCTRARAYAIMHVCDKAIADCDKILELDPKSAEAYSIRGRAWLFAKQYEKAIANCNQALELDAKLATAYADRGAAWMDKGYHDKALADFNRAISLNPKLAEAYIDRGNLSADRGENDKAMADYKRALEIAPDNWKAINDVGVSLWIQSQNQDVKAATAEAAGDKNAAKACRKKSAELKADAKRQWLHGIELQPAASDVHSNLGYAYSEAGNLDKAEHHLAEAVRFAPYSPRPHNNLGRIYLRRYQQLTAAAGEAEAKADTDPVSAAKAEKLEEQAPRELEQAIEQFKAAVALDNSLLEAHLNLGNVYLTLASDAKAKKRDDRAKENWSQAEAQYRAILNLRGGKGLAWDANVNFSLAYGGLAQVAIGRGMPRNAMDYLRQAMELNPRNVSALQSLVVCRYWLAEYVEGENNLAALLAMYPTAKRREVAEQLGKQLRDNGKHEAAKRLEEFQKKKM